jgi:hypothetical protein
LCIPTPVKTEFSFHILIPAFIEIILFVFIPSLKANSNLALKGVYNIAIIVMKIGIKKAVNFFFFIKKSIDNDIIRATVGALEEVKKKAVIPRVVEIHKSFFVFSSIKKEIRIGKLNPMRAAKIRGL